MVKEKAWKGKTVFECESCGFGYLDKKTAVECENYCNTHHSCSLEITRKAVKTNI